MGSLRPFVMNGLVAADSVIITLQCEYYALEGLSELLQTAAADLDRISSSLDAVRDELGRDAPETGR